MEEFLKRVNKPGEEAPAQTASPAGKAEVLSASSDSEDQERVTAAQTATLSTENQKPPSSRVAFAEPGESNLMGEAPDAAASGSDQGADRQERQLVPLDIPDYLRVETEDVSQGASVFYKLEMNGQWTSLPSLCGVSLFSSFTEAH